MRKLAVPVLVLLSLILHFPNYEAGRVFDFTGFILNMEAASWQEALGSFGYHVVQPLLQLFNYSLFTVAGESAMVYFLVFQGLFALGLWVWWKFLLAFSQSELIAFLILLAVVLNPYVVEVLTYKVCQAYLLSLIFLGGYLLVLNQYLSQGGRGDLLWMAGFLLAQLWTFDYILIYLPLTVLFCIFHGGWRWKLPILLSALALCFYFLQNQIFLGTWVGHYGAEVHLAFDLYSMMETMGKYVMKHLAFMQFFPFGVRSHVYQYSTLTLALIIFILMWKGKKAPRVAFFLLTGLLVLLPVSNLSFSEMMFAENDRYGFLFVIFLMGSVMSLLAMIPNNYARYGLIFLFLLGQCLSQQKMINMWRNSEMIIDSALSEWPAEFYDRGKKIYLLNLPDNYDGIFLFKNLESESQLFKESHMVRNVDTTYAEFVVVAQMNFYNPDNKVAVERQGQEVTVSFRQWGNWWWRNGLGAVSYEGDDYIFELKDLVYTVSFKEKSPIVYYFNGEWQRVDWF